VRISFQSGGSCSKARKNVRPRWNEIQEEGKKLESDENGGLCRELKMRKLFEGMYVRYEKTYIILAKVGLEFAGQNLERCGLSRSVGSNEAENLTRTRHRQTVQLELIGTVTVSGILGERLGKVDDLNGLKRTLLNADTATNAKGLRDEHLRRIGINLNTQLT
jgi:hypothetical protein